VEGEMKVLQVKEKLKEFTNTKPALPEISKEVPHLEMKRR